MSSALSTETRAQFLELPRDGKYVRAHTDALALYDWLREADVVKDSLDICDAYDSIVFGWDCVYVTIPVAFDAHKETRYYVHYIPPRRLGQPSEFLAFRTLSAAAHMLKYFLEQQAHD